MKTRWLVLLFVCSLVGCSTLTLRERLWCTWDHRSRYYSNGYEEFSKYPDYAISVYTINETYNPLHDAKHLRASISLCRQHFGKAYRARKLQRENEERGYDTNTFEFKPEYQPWLPFEPRYVVIAIANAADYSGPSSLDSSYKIAYIIPADLILSSRYDFQSALQASYVDRNPYHFDVSPGQTAWTSAAYKWLAIERHEAYLRTMKGVKPEWRLNSL